jgi:hypothetical protein
MKSARFVLLAVLTAAAGCGGSRQAVGTVSSVIVIATDSLWNAIGDSIVTALEPRIFTVRDERTFEVTHVSPANPNWTELRQFRQIVALGTATDPWVQPVLNRAERRGAGAAGTIVQASDVWARNQFATAVVLPESSAAEPALAAVPALSAALDSVFRVYAVQRMYTSRPDTTLRDSLRSNAGFSILLPNVYEQVTTQSDLLLFQNATQIGGTLIRSVLIASRDGLVEPAAETALAWRDSLAAAEYRPAQQTLRDRIATAAVSANGVDGVEVQGVWAGTDPTWPSSGPFIARMYPCPSSNRTILLDAWLFAPARAKYEYMIQLQTILDTFACA